MTMRYGAGDMNKSLELKMTLLYEALWNIFPFDLVAKC
jgi:hypothetical protein